MKRTLCIGDIHGGLKALHQVFERASVNPDNDELIFLGDLVDGWPESAQVVEYVRQLPNTTVVLGNHDEWTLGWLKTDRAPHIWTSQGGRNTLLSYAAEDFDKEAHALFFQEAKAYHIDNRNNLFVHGGFDWHKPIEDQYMHDLMWDRHLFVTAHMWQNAMDKGQEGYEIKEYNEVFIGHTTTSMSDPTLHPVHVSNVWCLDQGAGWEGKLTVMNVDTHEYWQSDIVKELYPEAKGR